MPGSISQVICAFADRAIKPVNGAPAVNNVHETVIDERRALMATPGRTTPTPFTPPKRNRERHMKVFHVVLVDLVKFE